MPLFTEIPDSSTTNPYFFSMQSIDGIQHLLNNYPVRETPDDKGCSISCCWSGSENNSVPVRPYNYAVNPRYNGYSFGIVLRPSRLDIPEANNYAYWSRRQVSDVEEKPKTFAASDSDDDHVARPVFKRRTEDDYYQEQILPLTNNAAWENLRHKNAGTIGIEYSTGNPSTFARNMWRKHFRNRKSTGRPAHANDDGTMKTNEGISFQRGLLNPIAGLLITPQTTITEIAQIKEIFAKNPSLSLFLYKPEAGVEFCMRVVNDGNKQIVLNSEIDFDTAFLNSKPTPEQVGRYIEDENPDLFRNMDMIAKVYGVKNVEPVMLPQPSQAMPLPSAASSNDDSISAVDDNTEMATQQQQSEAMPTSATTTKSYRVQCAELKEELEQKEKEKDEDADEKISKMY